MMHLLRTKAEKKSHRCSTDAQRSRTFSYGDKIKVTLGLRSVMLPHTHTKGTYGEPAILHVQTNNL